MTITAPPPAVTRRAAPAATPRTVGDAPTLGRIDSATLTQLEFAVDRDGIDAHEDAAQLLVDAATRHGVRPILIAILADRHEPSVVRERAFGRVALALAG